jgi:hypothetical protein
MTDDKPELIWMPVQQARGLLWADNPKMHDLGALMQSIQKYGIQELPIFDKTLGAIKAGNGRIEALALLEKQHPDNPPRGIVISDSGAWTMPVLGGVDAITTEQAIAYALDSNNLTLAGGDFTAVDMSRMWSKEYMAVLGNLAAVDELPVTVDKEMMEGLRRVLGCGTESKQFDNKGDNKSMLKCPECDYEWQSNKNPS